MDLDKMRFQIEMLIDKVEDLERKVKELEKGSSPDLKNYYTKTETQQYVQGEIVGAIMDLDASSTPVTGHIIRSIEQENGKIIAVSELVDTSPTPSSNKLITSGAVYAALHPENQGGE